MEKWTGVLTYTDARQVQNTVERNNLNEFFNELMVSQSGSLRDHLSSAFVNGSMRRSVFFMDYNIKDYMSYASRGGDFSNWLPVFGVKGGSPGLTRKTNYAEILICPESELDGSGFNEAIFGTDYLTGDETVSLSASALLGKMGREGSLPGFTVAKRDMHAIARVFEKLWEVQEKNPRTRFIIKLDHAEERSLNLLQQMYLLIPRKLRLQLGFETNIDTTDLDQIQNNGNLPIYILTAESTQVIDLERYDFPVVIYDFENADSYVYDEVRVQLIEKLARQMNQRKLSNLDYSETKVLEDRQMTASSFKYYQDIVSRLLTGDLFWWNRESVCSIDELEQLYMDQKDLMRNQDYHTEALESYNLTIYPNSNLAEQIVDLILQEPGAKRDRQISFLRREMNQEKTISALDTMNATLQKRSIDSENRLRATLNAEANRKLSEQKSKYEGNLNQIRRQLQVLTEDNRMQKQELEKLNRERENLISELDSYRADEQDDRQYTTSGRRKVKSKQIAKRLLIFEVLSALAVISTIVFLAFFIMNVRQVRMLQKENDRISKNLELADEENKSLNDKAKEQDKKIVELQKELDNLRSPLESSENDSDSVQSENGGSTKPLNESENDGSINPPQEVEEPSPEQSSEENYGIGDGYSENEYDEEDYDV